MNKRENFLIGLIIVSTALVFSKITLAEIFPEQMLEHRSIQTEDLTVFDKTAEELLYTAASADFYIAYGSRQEWVLPVLNWFLAVDLVSGYDSSLRLSYLSRRRAAEITLSIFQGIEPARIIERDLITETDLNNLDALVDEFMLEMSLLNPVEFNNLLLKISEIRVLLDISAGRRKPPASFPDFENLRLMR